MTEKMNPEVKKLWIVALRSGEYKQCKGIMRSAADGTNSYCCLGVLTDLAVKAGVTPSWNTSDMGVQALVEPKIARWAGILDAITTIDLARLNDQGKSFDYIATEIEKDL